MTDSMKKKKVKKEAYKQVDFLLSTYCEGCFLHKQIVKDLGRTHAHRFCINQCTVGESLKQIGTSLNISTEKPPTG